MNTKSRKQRLLFAIDSLVGGGAEYVICQIANNLDHDRYEIQIVLTLGSVFENQPNEHISVIDLPKYLEKNPISSKKYIEHTKNLLCYFLGYRYGILPRDKISFINLRADVSNFRIMANLFGRHVLAWHPDCIMSFLQNTNIITLLAKAWYRFPAPVICSDRNHLSSELPNLPWSKIREHFVKIFYRLAVVHIANSPVISDDLHECFGIPKKNIRIILNGVDHIRLKKIAGNGSLTLPSGISKDDVRLISIGRLNRQKGFDILIRALGRIRYMPWKLFLLGKGEEESALRFLTSELGLTDRIYFVGWQKNPYIWMVSSDIMIMSSRWEGMPNVLLEAMALGLPVIATDCPTGPRQILDHGRVGRLVENGSVENLAHAIAEFVASSPEERSQLGIAAYKRSQAFSFSQMIEDYQRLFDDTIAGKYPLGDIL